MGRSSKLRKSWSGGAPRSFAIVAATSAGGETGQLSSSEARMVRTYAPGSRWSICPRCCPALMYTPPFLKHSCTTLSAHLQKIEIKLVCDVPLSF